MTSAWFDDKALGALRSIKEISLHIDQNNSASVENGFKVYMITALTEHLA